MASTTTVEVWVLVDANGDYGIGKDAETAKDWYGSDIQAVEEADGFRLVKLTLTVPLPEVMDVAGEVVANDVPVTLTASA